MSKEFAPYDIALTMKELGFDEPCFGFYHHQKGLCKMWAKWVKYNSKKDCLAPLYQQALNFLYSASDGKINISINGKETNEERNKKFRQAIEDLWNLQNNKPY